MEKEIWTVIPNWTSYAISSLGRVMTLNNHKICEYGKILKVSITNQGYIRVGLSKNGLSRKVSMHRLVAKSFIPNPNNKPLVNHKNGIRHDNRVCNLEWATQSENIKHAYATGLQKPTLGENSTSSKLTAIEVLEIFNSKLKHRELAFIYKVHNVTISKIKAGKSWSHITGKIYKKKYLTADAVLEIHNTDVNDAEKVIAKLGTTRRNFFNIKAGRTNKSITGGEKKEYRNFLTKEIYYKIVKSSNSCAKDAEKYGIQPITVSKARRGILSQRLRKELELELLPR